MATRVRDSPHPFLEEKIRKIAAGTIALLVVAFGAHLAPAALNPAYKAPPDNFARSFVQVIVPNDTIRCTWDNNLGAPRYSVDTIANQDLNAGGTLSVDLDFDAATTTVDIALSAFPTDPDADGNPDTLVSVVRGVKGLDPAEMLLEGGEPKLEAEFVGVQIIQVA